MVGRNPLLVAKQHGHRLTTMLSVYAAWAEGAVESGITAIRAAMNRACRIGPKTDPALPGTGLGLGRPSSERFGSRFATGRVQPDRKPLKPRENLGGKGGTRTLDPGIMRAVDRSSD
jgi:hypothetical protein